MPKEITVVLKDAKLLAALESEAARGRKPVVGVVQDILCQWLETCDDETLEVIRPAADVSPVEI